MKIYIFQKSQHLIVLKIYVFQFWNIFFHCVGDIAIVRDIASSIPREKISAKE